MRAFRSRMVTASFVRIGSAGRRCSDEAHPRMTLSGVRSSCETDAMSSSRVCSARCSSAIRSRISYWRRRARSADRIALTSSASDRPVHHRDVPQPLEVSQGMHAPVACRDREQHDDGSSDQRGSPSSASVSSDARCGGNRFLGEQNRACARIELRGQRQQVWTDLGAQAALVSASCASTASLPRGASTRIRSSRPGSSGWSLPAPKRLSLVPV
jgi:hypothetical protein